MKLVLIVGLTLAGCSIIPGTTSNKIAAVNHQMLKVVNDEDGVKFRNETVVKDGVCGEMNAKNQFGGWTGYTTFFATDHDAIFNVPYMSGNGAEERSVIARNNLKILGECPTLPSLT